MMMMSHLAAAAADYLPLFAPQVLPCAIGFDLLVVVSATVLLLSLLRWCCCQRRKHTSINRTGYADLTGGRDAYGTFA